MHTKRLPPEAASWLIGSGDLVEGNLQLCSSVLEVPFSKFTFPTLESEQFLLRRLEKAVARCSANCVCSVITHPYDLPRAIPRYPSVGTGGRFDAVKLRIYDAN